MPFFTTRPMSRMKPIADETFSRSEEHTSELQSLAYLVCRLLLEKKKQTRALRSEEHTSELKSLTYLGCPLLLKTKTARNNVSRHAHTLQTTDRTRQCNVDPRYCEHV